MPRGQNIDPVHAPSAYAPAQLDLAVRVMAMMGRGRFVYTEPPARS